MNGLRVELDHGDPLFIVLSWNGSVWKKLYKYLFCKKLKPLFSAESFEEARTIFMKIEWKVAKSFAVNSLGRKALLTSELSQKMQEKGFSEDIIFKTIGFCQKIGAIDDFQILESRIQKEFRRGRGLVYARAKWRGSVREEPVEWDSLEKRNLEKEAILELMQKKGRNKVSFLFLLRRGFRSEVIKEVLNSEIE